MRVLVDTHIAGDKLKKVKKGFKYERFDVLFQIFEFFWGVLGTSCRELRSTDYVRHVRRGATRMGGLPFDSVRPNRSLRSDLKTAKTSLSPSIPAFHRLPAAYAHPYDQRSSVKTEPRETAPFFGRLPIHLQNQRPRQMRIFQSDWKVDPSPSGPELRKLDFLFTMWGLHAELWKSELSSDFAASECGTAFALWSE